MKSKTWQLTLTAVLLVVFNAQAALASPAKSASLDEQYHLVAGYAYLRTGDPRLSTDHPPLISALSALPLLLIPDVNLPLDHPAWARGDYFALSDALLWETNANPHKRLVLARLPVIALGVILVCALFTWARQMCGWRAGWLALALAVLDPNLIANSRLVTTDLGVTCLLLLATWRLWRWLEHPSRLNLLAVGALAGLTMTAKFTGLLFWPMAALIALIYPGGSVRRWWGLVGMALIAYGAVWAVYRFDFGPIPGASLAIPAPFYPYSVWRLFTIIQTEPVPTFLLGQVSPRGWWYYFPVAIAVKTPLPLLILAVAGAVLMLRRRAWRRASAIWAPMIMFLALALTGQLNIGYRHILPIVPFLILLASNFQFSISNPQSLLSNLRSRLINRMPILLSPFASLRAGSCHPSLRSGQALATLSPCHPVTLSPDHLVTLSPCLLVPLSPCLLICVLLIWQAVSVARIFPHDEAYFNELGGGPENGSRILVDSNLDWGQDLPALKRLLDERGIEQVNLAYFGSALPGVYGVRYRPLPSFLRFVAGPEIDSFNPYTPEPGWYAISATSLRLGLLYHNTDLYAYFRDKMPVARAGYSILLYDVSYPPDTPIDRAVVVGTPTYDIPPQTLGVTPGHRLVAKWAESSDMFIFAMNGPARYIVDDPLPFDRSLRKAFRSAAKRDGDPQGASAALIVDARPLVESRLAEWRTSGPLRLPDNSSIDWPADLGKLALIGYRLGSSQAAPGDSLDLTTYWQVTGELVPSPAFFAHVTNDGQHIAGQYDGWGTALRGLEIGDVIVQRVRVPIRADTAPGAYYLQLGVYSPDTMRRWLLRLPALHGAPADRVLLSSVEIISR